MCSQCSDTHLMKCYFSQKVHLAPGSMSLSPADTVSKRSQTFSTLFLTLLLILYLSKTLTKSKISFSSVTWPREQQKHCNENNCHTADSCCLSAYKCTDADIKNKLLKVFCCLCRWAHNSKMLTTSGLLRHVNSSKIRVTMFSVLRPLKYSRKWVF